MTTLNKETLEHLLELARLEISQTEKERILSDLQKILDYFEELKGLDTSDTLPMTGGVNSLNVLREDDPQAPRLPRGGVVEAFPEEKDGFLKIPPVFE